MNRNLLIGVGFFLAIVVGGFFIVGSIKSKPKIVQEQRDVSVQNPQATGLIREVSMSASEYSFSPAKVTANSGEHIKILFTNSGSFSHNITIPELGVESKTINPGESTVLEFDAGKKGVFSFYCSVGGHRDLGMKGELTIE